MADFIPTVPIPLGAEVGKVPRIGLQLDKTGSYRQFVSPDFIHRLIQDADPDLQLVPVVSPLLCRRTTSELARLQERAVEMDSSYQKVDFENWYDIRFEPPQGPQDAELGFDFSEYNGRPEDAGPDDYTIHPRFVRLVHQLHAQPPVLSVHLIANTPPPGIHNAQNPAPLPPVLTVNRNQNPMHFKQSYLDPAPMGVDAAAAWARPGGDGTDLTLFELECGWDLLHDDLVHADTALVWGDNYSQMDHGTMALGPILMVDNQIGGVGIAPKVSCRMISVYRNTVRNIPEAIIQAILRCSFGDIILLELQDFDPVSGRYMYPVEVVDINYQVIRLATSLGITVIEPSCNAELNLDNYISLNLEYIFNRTYPSFRDSGAIMVGACDDLQPPPRADFSNHGSRIDAYALGEWVASTSTDAGGTVHDQYTDDFSGTSSATAIVTGAVVAAQGVMNGRWGYKLGPRALRHAICYGGSRSADPATDLIGVMPDLRAAIAWIDALPAPTTAGDQPANTAYQLAGPGVQPTVVAQLQAAAAAQAPPP